MYGRQYYVFVDLIEVSMITLRGKLKKDGDLANSKNRDYNKRISVRDKLLVKEVDTTI